MSREGDILLRIVLFGVYALRLGSGGREEGFCSVVLGSGTVIEEKQHVAMSRKEKCRER